MTATSGDRVEVAPKLTAEAALAAHGFTWERLEKLARRALNDGMGERGISLDADRYQEALEKFYVETGARWAIEFDPAKANGVSFATSCYRRMKPRVLDFLRERHGDQRRGDPITEIPVDRLPDGAMPDAENLEQAIAEVARGLPERARWTLEHLARPLTVQGLMLSQVAAAAGVTYAYAEELLEELGWLLGRQPLAMDEASTDFALMERWAAA